MLKFISKIMENFVRKIGLVVIDVVIRILWFVDRATRFTFKQATNLCKKIIVAATASAGLIVLGYFLYSGYLNNLFQYIFFDKTAQVQTRVSYPARIRYLPMPGVSAKSILVMDRGKGRVLYEKNSNDKLAPASTVKLLTALVALDLYSPNEELSVPKECTEIEGTKAGFPKESVFTVGDLVNGMLIGSLGDSACVLASKRVTNGAFVELMNKKAASIGMLSTKVSNPIGLDDVNGGNYSTASDLYKLAVYSTNIPRIREDVRTTTYILHSSTEKYSGIIYNTNKFLWEVPNTVGIKTGTTLGAGEVLIYEYSDGLRDIVIVVMGSSDRFSDTKNILDWVLSSYTWK
jgi:D-alanyl-D-alanine carboxypeptidase (penicillin-binding protein 5/6)